MFVSSSLLTKILIGSLVGILVIGGVIGSRMLMKPGDPKESASPQAVPSSTDSSSVIEERIRNLEISLAEVINVLKTTTGKTINTPTQVNTLETRVKSLETSVTDLQTRVKALESGTKVTSTTTTTSSSTKAPDYIRLSWNNSTTSTDWGSVGSTEISIAGSDYPGYTNMRFEVSLKTSGSGRAYARLFNKDDNSAITGSEVSTDATTSTWVYSGNFTLPSNRKTYYLQMKSTNGVGAQASDAQVRVSY